VKLELELPSIDGLYPMNLAVHLNGRRVWEERYPSVGTGAGKQTVVVPLPADMTAAAPLEIVLLADSHFETFDDHRMRSFQIDSAALVSSPGAEPEG
jgi:hypothetical protein